uniref:Uncharacterized protein n=1 Tax=Oryza rufipogon TaxID=4529 RepID=A0A0E0MUC6_ORYRU
MAATDALRPHHVDRDPGHGGEILERLLLLLLPRCLGRRPLALGHRRRRRRSSRHGPELPEAVSAHSAAITLVLSPPNSSDSSSTIDAIDQSSKNLTQQRDRSEWGEKKTKQARNCTQLLGDSAVATSDFGFGWIGNSSSSGGCYISHRDCSARGYGGRAAGGILVPP